MWKCSKLGAMSLALALSLTLIAPISANAEVLVSRTDTGKKNDEGQAIYLYEVKNEDTGNGDTVEGTERLGVMDLERAYQSDVKAVTIGTKTYESIDLRTTVDVNSFSNFKSSSKNLKVKLTHKDELKDPDPNDEDYDYKDKDGKYVYRNVNGEIIKETDITKCPKTLTFGEYTIRFYAVKAGTYKLTYNANCKDNAVVKKTIKVIVKDDASPFKSVTFAGKSIIDNKYTLKRNELLEKGSFENRTAKKSGVLRVKMNKGFELKKIEVGKYRYQKKEIKDADAEMKYFEPMNDRFEDNREWKTIKNNKKLKLNNDDTDSFNDTRMDAPNGFSYNSSNKGTWAITPIRITYYDQKDKTTHRTIIEIHKLINK